MLIETVGLLAGAYNKQTEKNQLRHSVADYADTTLCGKIKAEKLADNCAYSEEELKSPPSCKACLKKDPRFQGVK